MNPRLRRQSWILLLIALVAYWWWDSIGTDRYGTIPEDSRPRESLPLPSLLDHAWQADMMIYESHSTHKSIVIRTSTSADTLFAHIETTSESELVRDIEAILLDAYYPASIIQTRAGEPVYVVTVADSEIVMHRPGGEAATTFPNRHGALYDDLLLLQIQAWKGIPDSVMTELVSFASDGQPIRIHPITLRPEGDSAITILFGVRQNARVVFSPGSRRVLALRTAQGETYVLRTPEEGL